MCVRVPVCARCTCVCGGGNSDPPFRKVAPSPCSIGALPLGRFTNGRWQDCVREVALAWWHCSSPSAYSVWKHRPSPAERRMVPPPTMAPSRGPRVAEGMLRAGDVVMAAGGQTQVKSGPHCPCNAPTSPEAPGCSRLPCALVTGSPEWV